MMDGWLDGWNDARSVNFILSDFPAFLVVCFRLNGNKIETVCRRRPFLFAIVITAQSVDIVRFAELISWESPSRG